MQSQIIGHRYQEEATCALSTASVIECFVLCAIASIIAHFTWFIHSSEWRLMCSIASPLEDSWSSERSSTAADCHPWMDGRRIWTHAIHFYRFPPYLDFDLHCRRKDWRQERWRGGIMLLIIGRCTLSCAPATDAASLAHLTAVGQVMKRNEWSETAVETLTHSLVSEHIVCLSTDEPRDNSLTLSFSLTLDTLGTYCFLVIRMLILISPFYNFSHLSSTFLFHCFADPRDFSTSQFAVWHPSDATN